MVNLERDGPIALMAVGVVLMTVSADLVSSNLALVLVLGGSALAWGTILVMGLFLDDKTWGRFLGDERMTRITNRSGATAWLCTLAALVTLSRVLDYSEQGRRRCDGGPTRLLPGEEPDDVATERDDENTMDRESTASGLI